VQDGAVDLKNPSHNQKIQVSLQKYLVIRARSSSSF
jgi:hypothetical protein